MYSHPLSSASNATLTSHPFLFRSPVFVQSHPITLLITMYPHPSLPCSCNKRLPDRPSIKYIILGHRCPQILLVTHRGWGRPETIAKLHIKQFKANNSKPPNGYNRRAVNLYYPRVDWSSFTSLSPRQRITVLLVDPLHLQERLTSGSFRCWLTLTAQPLFLSTSLSLTR